MSLSEEISEGGVMPFGGSESSIAHSVKGNLDSPVTLMLTLVHAIIFATIHLLNHQADQQKEQIFLMSLR